MAGNCVAYFLCLSSLLLVKGVNSDEDFSVVNCHKKADPGFCMASITRWYFNDTWNNCTKFIYGGCKGNKNNFETRKECEEKCLHVHQDGSEFQSSHGDKVIPTTKTIPEGPCTIKKKKKAPSILMGIILRRLTEYTPVCDAEGYFKPKQCKHYVVLFMKQMQRVQTVCWYVDRWGNAIKDSEEKDP